MKNIVQPGDRITFTAGSDVSSGDAVVIANILAVAVTDVASGEDGEAVTEGVVTLPAETATFNQGEQVHWDVSEGKLLATGTATASGDLENVGTVWADSDGGTVDVKLAGIAVDLTA